MRLVEVPLESLAPAARNANRMPDDKYRALVESIRRVGFVVPIVVRKLAEDEDVDNAAIIYEIVDGHHRVRALAEIGIAEASAVVLEGGEDPRLVSLALNRLRGETDLAVASLIVEELLEAEVDMSISGFTGRELEALVSALESPDDPELSDLEGTEAPEEVGTPSAKPFLLDLTFRSKEDLAAARKALKKAAGKGGDLSDGLLRLIRAEA